MKRLFSILISLFILASLVIAAEEDLSGSSELHTQIKLDSMVDVKSVGNEFFLESMDVDLTFYPRDTPFQSIQTVDYTTKPNTRTEPKGQPLYQWGQLSAGPVEYGYVADVVSYPYVVKVTEEPPFPLPSIEVDDLYLSATETIKSDSPQITARATEIVAGETDTFRAAHKIGVWVNDNIEYSLETLTEKATQDADWVFENRRGVCDELTTLFVSMVRSVGIPAKFVSGMVYSNTIDGFAPHAWAEIYLPGTGWVPFDPTFGQLGFVDAAHIKMDEPLDYRDASVEFTWKSRDANIEPEELSFDVETVSSIQQLQSSVTLGVKALVDDVGASSYVPIEVKINNPNTHYAATSLTLTKVPTKIEPIIVQVLVEPQSTQRVYFVIQTPDELLDGYSYTSEIGVKDFFGSVGETEIHYALDGEYVSKEEAENIYKGLEDETKQQVAYFYFCDTEKESFYTYEEVVAITCSVKSLSNVILTDVKLCFDDECETFDLGIAQEKKFEFVKPVVEKDYDVTLEVDRKRSKKTVMIKPKEVPTLEAEFLNTFETIGYDETKTLSIQLEMSEPLTKINVEGTGLKASGKDKKSLEDGVLKVQIEGKKIYPGDEVDLVLTYKDKNGREYEKKESLTVKVINVPFLVKVKQVLFGWLS